MEIVLILLAFALILLWANTKRYPKDKNDDGNENFLEDFTENFLYRRKRPGHQFWGWGQGRAWNWKLDGQDTWW